jgi:hypothetical protein
LIIINIIIKQYLTPINDISLYKSIHYFENNKDSIKIIFLGDSQVYYGINPDCISSMKNIHNFGFPSEPIQTTYWKIKYYLDTHSLKKLQLAIINADYDNFTSEERVGINTLYDYYKYYNYYFRDIIKYMGYREIIYLIGHRIDIFRWRSYFVTLIMNKFKPPLNEQIMPSGYCERKYSRVDKIQSIEAINKYDKDPNQSIVMFYNKLINLFREHGIEIIFIKMPNHVKILSQGEIDLKYENEELITENIIKTKLQAIKLLNYNSRFNWRVEHFSDKGHLNSKGACILGELIKEDLVTQVLHN